MELSEIWRTGGRKRKALQVGSGKAEFAASAAPQGAPKDDRDQPKGTRNLTSNSIFRLLYVSTASASAAMALHETMRAILLASDANNRRDDITGFLLSDGYVFVQVLEGPETSVRDCFSRICEDRRHHNPKVRDAGPATERLFPQWSMCGLNLSGRDNALLRPGHIGFDLLGAAPGALLQHLHTLVQHHGPALIQAHAPLLGPLHED